MPSTPERAGAADDLQRMVAAHLHAAFNLYAFTATQQAGCRPIAPQRLGDLLSRWIARRPELAYSTTVRSMSADAAVARVQISR